MQVERVVVAVADPEESLQPVIDRAAELAQAAGAKLILFHAVFEPALSARPLLDSTRLARARGALVAQRTRDLERRAIPLRQRGLTVQTHVVWEEPAYESIIRAAIRENADLVVAGPHARGRTIVPFSFRQTDWQLLRFCPRPLLMIRTVDAQPGPVLAALDPLHLNDKPASLDAKIMETASVVAQQLGVELHVVHSVPDTLYPLGSTKRSQAEVRKKISKQLICSVKRYGVPANRVQVQQGLPERTLPVLAEEHEARMIVLGAISRPGLTRFAIFDTAERIIDAVPCDVLIVKPDKFKLVLGRARRQRVILPKEG